MSSLDDFLQQQRELLAKERDEELKNSALLLSKCDAKLLERKGLTISSLSVINSSIGLGGKILVDLERPSYHSTQTFTPHAFRTGDLARIESNKPPVLRLSSNKKPGAEVPREGVIYKLRDTRITVALDPALGDGAENDFSLPDPCRIVKIANTVTFERMEKAMDRIAAASLKAELNPLHKVLLAQQPRSAPEQPIDIDFFDPHMNDSQKEAVRFCLRAPEVACIHGPPGTGKSRTVIELILQFTTVTAHNPKPLRVLICGASNLSVDNILERLLKIDCTSKPGRITATRIGHPARVMAKSDILEATLDVQARRTDQAALANDVKKELDHTLNVLNGKQGKRPKGPERKTLWNDVKVLRKEFRQRDGKVVESVLSEAQIILATCHSSGSKQLQGLQFDVLIIDEATQATEAVCWIPILKSKKLILVGDPMQLPPTVISKRLKTGKKAREKTMKPGKGTSESSLTPATKEPPKLLPPSNLSHTLFRRLEEMYGSPVKRMLEVQYRMNSLICQFPSNTLYNSKLKPHRSVQDHLLVDLPNASSRDDDLMQPIVFFDTAGCEYYERMDGDSEEGSKYNEHEAEIGLNWLGRLICLGIHPSQIAFIAPYQAQVNYLTPLINSRFGSELEIGTVDGMQGREKEAVVISLVRSNDKREVGFLADKRRLNVAMTRSRRQLCVIGDSSTVLHGGQYLSSWMSWLEENADVRYGGID